MVTPVETTSPRTFCSVIVPTYRRPERLAACLEALTRLDYPRDRLEVIVANDDGGVDLDGVVEPFREALRLTLLVQPLSSGPAAARNAAAERAEGELLAFTDDDCRPDPHWLEILAARYEAHPERGFGGHTVNELVGNRYSSTSQLVIDVGYAFLNSDGDTARFLTTNNLAVSAARFRELGGFDTAFRTAEDRDFCARWIACGWKLTYVPEAIVYHAHELTLTSFCRQHFAYGRGAFRYHHEQARRWGRRFRIDLPFYRSIATAPFQRDRPSRAIAISALLGVWNLMNTAGFVWEWLLLRRGVPRQAEPAPARMSDGDAEKAPTTRTADL